MVTPSGARVLIGLGEQRLNLGLAETGKDRCSGLLDSMVDQVQSMSSPHHAISVDPAHCGHR